MTTIKITDVDPGEGVPIGADEAIGVTGDDGRLGTNDIKDGAVTKAKLAQDAQYNLPVAKSNVLGGVKIGSGITVTDDGTISATASPYNLPPATKTTLGGIKVGDRLSVTSDGTLSAEEASVADGSITNAKLAKNAVTSDNIDWTTMGPRIVARGYETINTPEDNSHVRKQIQIPEQPNNHYQIFLSKENGLNHGPIAGEAVSTSTTYFTLHQWRDGAYLESWCRWNWMIIRWD